MLKNSLLPGSSLAERLPDASVDAALDLISLGSLLKPKKTGGIAGSRMSLRSWNPWTNQRTPRRQPGPSTGGDEDEIGNKADTTLTGSARFPEAATTTKAAGGLYDAMVDEERREAARLATAARLLSSNNNTNELGGGLRDVQRHKAGGQWTTVITQLASEPATGGGGVLDINFVMDSQSSNATVHTGVTTSTVDSNDTSALRFSHDGGGSAGRRFPQDSGSRGGAGRNTDKELPSRDTQQQLQHRTTAKPTLPPNHGQTKQPWEWESGTDVTATGALLGNSGAGGSDVEGSGAGGSDVEGSGGARGSDVEGSGAGGGGAGGVSSETEDTDGNDGEGTDDNEEEEEEEETAPLTEEKQSQPQQRKKLSIGHLQKEGILIGCMNVFADVMKKEFTVLMTDEVVSAFLLQTSLFRAVATRTGCEIEVTRRILNRCIAAHRWVKYLVITIKGPNMLAIHQCDRLMIKQFPLYKMRREYIETAHVSLFVKESYPDNSKLYFNFQRTGPCRIKLGELRLETPFESSALRPLEHTPWKYADWRLFRGMLEPRNITTEHAIQHVYPEWGTEVGNHLNNTHRWELAGDVALDIEKRNMLERSLRVKNRKAEAEALFAEEAR